MVPIIFLVDDDDNDEELARIAFERAGLPHRLCVARDGAEALDWLFCRGSHDGRPPTEVPHVVLLDLKLPRLTGLEVLAALRDDPRTARLPVVVFTSSLEQRDLEDAYRFGANAYVRKPVDYREYKALIAEVGSFWTRHNQLPVPLIDDEATA